MKKIVFILVVVLLLISAGVLYFQNREIRNLRSELVKNAEDNTVQRSIYKTDDYSFSIPENYVVSLTYIDYNNAISFGPESPGIDCVGCDYVPEMLFVDNSKKNIEFYWDPVEYETLRMGEYNVELWIETLPERKMDYLPTCRYQFRILDEKYIFCLNSLSEAGLTEINKRISTFKLK